METLIHSLHFWALDYVLCVVSCNAVQSATDRLGFCWAQLFLHCLSRSWTLQAPVSSTNDSQGGEKTDCRETSSACIPTAAEYYRNTASGHIKPLVEWVVSPQSFYTFTFSNCWFVPVLLGVGVWRLPITVTTGPTGKEEGLCSVLHTWAPSTDENTPFICPWSVKTHKICKPNLISEFPNL